MAAAAVETQRIQRMDVVCEAMLFLNTTIEREGLNEISRILGNEKEARQRLRTVSQDEQLSASDENYHVPSEALR